MDTSSLHEDVIHSLTSAQVLILTSIGRYRVKENIDIGTNLAILLQSIYCWKKFPQQSAQVHP